MKHKLLLLATCMFCTITLQAQTQTFTLHTPVGPISIPVVLIDSLTLDIDTTDVPAEPLTPLPDNVDVGNYTVIMLMQPGNNDAQTVADMIQMIALHETGEIDSSIHVVGLIKPSPIFQRLSGLNYSFKFDLAKMGVPEDILSSMSQISAETFEPGEQTHASELYSVMKASKGYRDLIYPYLKITRWGDADEDINNAATVTKLIKEAVAEHPAKHYVFILYGHGAGYDPTTDPTNAAAYTTEASKTMRRICLPDENIKGNDGIALDEFMLGIKNSGVKFQTLLTQCCLMASLENMTAYAHQFDYFLGSDEATRGGYFPKFIANLSGVEGNEEKLENAYTNIVEFYVNLTEQMNYQDYEFASSYGWYDLRKMPTLLASVKKATDWLIDANQKDSVFMRETMLGAYYTTEAFEGKEQYENEIYSYRDLFLNPENHKDVDEETVHKALVAMLKAVQTDLRLDFVFSTILKAGLEQDPAEHPSLDFNSLQAIYDEYLTALKDMAYINCDQGTLHEKEDPYIFTSPSVQLFNFNKDAYFPYITVDAQNEEELYYKTRDIAHELWEAITNGSETIKDDLSTFYRGNPYAVQLMRATIKGEKDKQKLYNVDYIANTYCGTRFHLATGWGNLLKQTTYNPNLLWNPVRTTKAVSYNIPTGDDDDDNQMNY